MIGSIIHAIAETNSMDCKISLAIIALLISVLIVCHTACHARKSTVQVVSKASHVQRTIAQIEYAMVVANLRSVSYVVSVPVVCVATYENVVTKSCALAVPPLYNVTMDVAVCTALAVLIT